MAVKKKSHSKKANRNVILLISTLVIFFSLLSFSIIPKLRLKPTASAVPQSNNSTPTPTASELSSPVLPWQPYSSTDLNISFTYPEIYYKNIESSKTKIYLSPTKGKGSMDPSGLDINDKWIEITMDTPIDLPADADKKSIIVDGISGYEFLTNSSSASGKPVRHFYIAWFTVNKHTYTITLNSWGENSIKKTGDFFSEFLSGFQFRQATLNTAGWKTFSYLNFYTLKYPKDLKLIGNAYDAAKLTKISACDPFNTSLCLFMPGDYFPNSNFVGAGFAVTNLPGPMYSSQNTCTETNKNITDLGSQDIGSYKYHVFSRSGSAVNTQSNEKNYYLFQKEHCFKITSRILTETNSSGDQITLITDNDVTSVERIMENIMSTLKFR